MIRVSVQHETFDIAVETVALEAAGVGAVATFTGIVRGDDGVTAIELEHYPGMAEDEIKRVVDEACTPWPLSAVSVIHRYGVMKPGDGIVFVGTASTHRAEAFAACEFLMDYLKTRAPFWN